MIKCKVTPWEVKGDIRYGQLIKQFGLKPIKELPTPFNKFLLFRRGIIYAHRDLDKIINAYKNKKPFAMMTGLMPSGKFHFGHKLVADQMLFYQKLGAKLYITVADLEAYNSRDPDVEKLRKTALEEYLTNYIALGLKPKNCNFYFQSERSKDSKKSNAYYKLQNMLVRYTTFNEFKAIYGEISPGKMTASLLQAADMLHPQLPEFEGKQIPTVVPVGTDQDPHIRLARDISQRIKNPKFTQITSTYHKFLPGLKNGKMSSSDGTSFISLTDSQEEVARKIKKYAFSGGQETVDLHRKHGGNPEIDVSFQLLKYGLETSDKKLQKIHKDYSSGNMLTSELKAYTIKKAQEFLKEHQKKREKAKKQVSRFLKQ